MTEDQTCEENHRAERTASKRRWLSFRLRTLFVLVTIMGVVFVVSGKWPVTEVIKPFSRMVISANGPMTLSGAQATIIRPPTSMEMAIREGVSFLVVVLALALISVRSNRTRPLQS